VLLDSGTNYEWSNASIPLCHPYPISGIDSRHGRYCAWTKTNDNPVDDHGSHQFGYLSSRPGGDLYPRQPCWSHDTTYKMSCPRRPFAAIGTMYLVTRYAHLLSRTSQRDRGRNRISPTRHSIFRYQSSPYRPNTSILYHRSYGSCQARRRSRSPIIRWTTR